jgi:GNAT superfamily N-acetyltransferase
VVRVRAAEPSDIDALQALAVAFATSFTVERDTVAKTLPSLLERPDGCVLVAERTGVVVGYLLGFLHPTFYANGPVGWVEELMVAPGCRRQGVGRDLMRGFEAWVTSRRGKLVALATRRAAAFYDALGYEESAAYLRKVL